jgi:hypothetical protein
MLATKTLEPSCHERVGEAAKKRSWVMGRYMLLWLLGVPIPILVLIWAFGGLH